MAACPRVWQAGSCAHTCCRVPVARRSRRAALGAGAALSERFSTVAPVPQVSSPAWLFRRSRHRGQALVPVLNDATPDRAAVPLRPWTTGGASLERGGRTIACTCAVAPRNAEWLPCVHPVRLAHHHRRQRDPPDPDRPTQRLVPPPSSAPYPLPSRPAAALERHFQATPQCSRAACAVREPRLDPSSLPRRPCLGGPRVNVGRRRAHHHRNDGEARPFSVVGACSFIAFPRTVTDVEKGKQTEITKLNRCRHMTRGQARALGSSQATLLLVASCCASNAAPLRLVHAWKRTAARKGEGQDVSGLRDSFPEVTK